MVFQATQKLQLVQKVATHLLSGGARGCIRPPCPRLLGTAGEAFHHPSPDCSGPEYLGAGLPALELTPPAPAPLHWPSTARACGLHEARLLQLSLGVLGAQGRSWSPGGEVCPEAMIFLATAESLGVPLCS